MAPGIPDCGPRLQAVLDNERCGEDSMPPEAWSYKISPSAMLCGWHRWFALGKAGRGLVRTLRQPLLERAMRQGPRPRANGQHPSASAVWAPPLIGSGPSCAIGAFG